MSKSILTKKRRLQTAIELMPTKVELFYDLFCDHGLLGLALREKFSKTPIFWNDSNDALIENLKLNKAISDSWLLKGKAQELALKENAGVFMLGVGGHLMGECFKSWQEGACLFPNQYFVLAPTYYQLSLRGTLDELGANLISRAFVWERNVGHELFLATFKKQEDESLCWRSFDSSFWSATLEEEPRSLNYLKNKMVSYKKNRHLNSWETKYAEDLSIFLSQN